MLTLLTLIKAVSLLMSVMNNKFCLLGTYFQTHCVKNIVEICNLALGPAVRVGQRADVSCVQMASLVAGCLHDCLCLVVNPSLSTEE